MSHLMALDQGTTSSRAVIFEIGGRVVASSQHELPQIFPRPGWVEHDPQDIYETQHAAARDAFDESGLSPEDILGIGITNQRETTVIWERDSGLPIANAIVWQDRRTATRCEELRAAGVEDTVRAKTGLLLDPYFSGTKVAWLLDNIPGARRRANAGELAFGTIDSWLIFRLSAGAAHVTDVSNASRTLLFDIHTCAWDDELLAIFDVPRGILPEVRTSTEIVATCQVDSPLRDRPIAGVLGDQQAATLGQGCTSRGLAKCTFGTGCFMLANTGAAPPVSSQHRLLSTVAWKHGEQMTYALEGSVFVGGAIVQWLRDGLEVIRDSSEVEALASRVEDSEDLLFVPALSGLGAPHWDPHARGMMIGMTRGTTSAHIARAALDSIAFQVADLVDVMERDAGIAFAELRVDGGATANTLLMQTQADMIQRPVLRPKNMETTALGAAYAAGLALGCWASLDSFETHHQIDRVFEPSMPPSEVASRRARWGEAVERAKRWARPAEG